MQSEAAVSEIPAQQELERRLAQLQAQIDDVPEDKRARLTPLWASFDALRAAARGGQPDGFVRALVALAGAVITLRREHKGDAHLGRLTVPPYDLWLPFKAASIAPSDAMRFASQGVVWNDKIVACVDDLAGHAKRPAPGAESRRATTSAEPGDPGPTSA